MSKAPRKTQEQSLESILWNCRNALRGTVGGNEKNRDAVMGLVFLKFAGDKFERRRAELLAKHGDVPAFLEKRSFYGSDNVPYINETARWPHIVKSAGADDIAIVIDRAMADIEDGNPPLRGALPQNFYASLGAQGRQIKGLIDEINKIDESRFHDKDLVGRVYEYFLQVFAMDAGQGAEKGEFYTPASIVNLIAELIEPYSGVVYDPCCGSGGMFVQSVKFVESHNGSRSKISVKGQESNPDTWRLAKMNLAIRGIAHNLGDAPASTFLDDRHKDTKVDFIMANPPFNLKKWRGADELANDPRFRGYGAPPVSNANYAWILHMLSKLDETDGVAGFLLANGALNADGAEGEIRKKLIENDKIEAILVLPREMFYSTDISVTLWIVRNSKKAGTLNGRRLRDRRGQTLFVDLRRWDANVYEKKYVRFDEAQIAAIKKIYADWQTGEGYADVPELCRQATIEDMRAKGHSLAPSKYIEFVDRDAGIDYPAEMERVRRGMADALAREREALAALEGAFGGIGLNAALEPSIKATGRGVSRAPIGDLLEEIDVRNSDGAVRNVQGININKEFMPSVANLTETDLTKYKVVRKNQFAYSSMQTGRDESIRMALFQEDEPAIVSPAYSVLQIKGDSALAEYVMLWFSRRESDRYGWFISDGSIRSSLELSRFFEIEIPLPPLEQQRAAASLYNARRMMQRNMVALGGMLKDLCPILIKGSMEEAAAQGDGT